MSYKLKNSFTRRSDEITQKYFDLLDKHLTDIIEGRALEMMELNQIASELFISHKHLSDTIQATKGHHPCYFYDLKIVEQAKNMLLNTDYSIAKIARTLTYDPSNFSKFFKKFSGATPGEFRKSSIKK
ncbi:helix-turn-helix domain-containing protein [Pedobacter antarcticus]|uniref:helix-turn-helix domain-containing protein n=1 Tax=Pedobacter antarcticus TaxID=34086 RepID=UPI001C592DF4|nr:AraC family transcriptional regulator [Pedobacter antarcticus]